jgi:hypothetical protein
VGTHASGSRLRANAPEGQKRFPILLFDEADALSGKRSEVEDSYERYASIEVIE